MATLELRSGEAIDPDPLPPGQLWATGLGLEGSGTGLGLPVLAALVGGLLERRTRGATMIAGSPSLGGSLERLPNPVAIAELAVVKQARVVLMPVSARRELMNIPDDLWTRVNIEYYLDADDGVFKLLE